MQLENYPEKHFTYCTNIHAGETWHEVFKQLKSNIPKLKDRISPSRPFGIGLRLSANAAAKLLENDHLKTFKDWLKAKDLYVFTMNGFPYGNFHRQRVKDLVYKPDWRTAERLNYTQNLVKILADLLPEGVNGGISTSPLSYKYWLAGPSDKEQVFRKATENLARVALGMHRIKQDQGKELHLDIEPEPDCLLENTQETIDFFTNWLFPLGGKFLANEFDLSVKEASDILHHHIGVCYDTCHFAVEYEHPGESIKKFRDAEIRIGKTQISAALKVQLKTANKRKKIAGKLQRFEESTYLHQVIEKRSNGQLYQYRDLQEAIPQIHHSKAEEWRIHYHVPIFMNEFDYLGSTQNEIVQSLKVLLKGDLCHHFEIETYTWEVLPDDLKITLLDSIEREFQWVFQQLR